MNFFNRVTPDIDFTDEAIVQFCSSKNTFADDDDKQRSPPVFHMNALRIVFGTTFVCSFSFLKN